jgi:serine/threonine protein kinase
MSDSFPANMMFPIFLHLLGFTLDGTVMLFDFGLARIVENASVSNEVYEMSGETGSLRYMAPEVADCQPYNQKADVYSYGKLFWIIYLWCENDWD